MPPELTKMTFEGAERFNTSSNSMVRANGPSRFVAKFRSKPSAENSKGSVICVESESDANRSRSPRLTVQEETQNYEARNKTWNQARLTSTPAFWIST